MTLARIAAIAEPRQPPKPRQRAASAGIRDPLGAGEARPCLPWLCWWCSTSGAPRPATSVSDPEVEAQHSEEEAVRVCRDAVESRLAARDPSIVGPGRPEYLQGGEYDVRLEVELDDGTLRTGKEVLCQVQFTSETGWVVEDVSLNPN